MKKRFFMIVIIAAICNSIYSQSEFSLSDVAMEYGKSMFVNEADGVFTTMDGKDYVTIPMEGISQKDLFHKMMLGLNNIYMDIDKVV